MCDAQVLCFQSLGEDVGSHSDLTRDIRHTRGQHLVGMGIIIYRSVFIHNILIQKQDALMHVMST